MEPGVFRFEFLIPIAIGIGLMAWSVIHLAPYFRARKWPKSEALLRTVQIGRWEEPNQYGSTTYAYPVVEYEYEVNDRRYVGSGVSFEMRNVWELADDLLVQRAHWAGWKAGDRLPAYFDPEHPEHAVLFPRLTPRRRSHYSAIFVSGILCIAVGVHLLVWVG